MSLKVLCIYIYIFFFDAEEHKLETCQCKQSALKGA